MAGRTRKLVCGAIALLKCFCSATVSNPLLQQSNEYFISRAADSSLELGDLQNVSFKMSLSDLTRFSHTYIDGPKATALNTLEVWLPKSNPDGLLGGKWVVYIHGGAWRDPLVDASSFESTIENLIHNRGESEVVGYASINYRLSEYPNHPTQPNSPEDPSRNAQHPDHVNDVTRALLYLEKKYAIDSRYVLVGHSCGATLAFQVPDVYDLEDVPLPACIIGSEGIYDLKSLLAVYDHVPFYRQFTVAAFGEVERAWDEASPYSSTTPAMWATVRTLIISHSEDDDLVDKGQAKKMLERVADTTEWDGRSRYVPASGTHNEMWQRGSELARVIKEGLESWRLERA